MPTAPLTALECARLGFRDWPIKAVPDELLHVESLDEWTHTRIPDDSDRQAATPAPGTRRNPEYDY
jgi:hypothetical protein